MHFLIRNTNKAFTEVMKEKASRPAGRLDGLEMLCIFHHYGPKVYIDKMKELPHCVHCSEVSSHVHFCCTIVQSW